MAIYPIHTSSQARMSSDRFRAVAAWRREQAAAITAQNEAARDADGDGGGGGGEDGVRTITEQPTSNSNSSSTAPMRPMVLAHRHRGSSGLLPPRSIPDNVNVEDVMSELGVGATIEPDAERLFVQEHGKDNNSNADDALRQPRVLKAPLQRNFARRRNSPHRRDGLLKGKDGSRRRKRWENDRLLNNPWVQPPTADDWEIKPTHPRHDPMPYALASLWDTHYAERHARAITAIAEDKARRRLRPGDVDGSLNAMCKEIRRKFKYARAATGLLRDLEENIRAFIHAWRMAEHDDGGVVGSESSKRGNISEASYVDAAADADSEDDVLSFSDDESVVFRGRGDIHGPKRTPQMQPPPPAAAAAAEPPSPVGSSDETSAGLPMPQKMIFQSNAEEPAASFGRWLVHSLGRYYGLRTWSVTCDDMREAYVGVPPDPRSMILPKPLWGTV